MYDYIDSLIVEGQIFSRRNNIAAADNFNNDNKF